MQVRQGRAEDLDGVMSLVRRVVSEMRASGNLQWDDEYPNATVFDRDVALGQLWIVEVEGRMVGIAAVTTEQEPEYEEAGWDVSEVALVVHRLVVDPQFRGMGVASALMRQAEGVARMRSIGVMRVDTNTENEASQRLFPKLGYVPAGEIGLSFRPGLRFRCYEKRLT